MLTIRVEHVFIFPAGDSVASSLKTIIHMLEVIMTNQADAVTALNQVSAQLDNVATELAKVKGETTSLVQEIGVLTQTAQNSDISPALQEAIDAVSARVTSVAAAVQAVDDLVPDAPAPAPAPAGT